LQAEDVTLIQVIFDFCCEGRLAAGKFFRRNGCSGKMEKLFTELYFLLDSVMLPEHQHHISKEEHADKKEYGKSQPQLNFLRYA